MDKENVYTFKEYNLALKKWEILQYATTWMYLELTQILCYLESFIF